MPPPGTSGSTKFNQWLEPSRFRGVNITYFNYGEGTKTLDDFRFLKDAGATVVQIQSVEGTRHHAPPYGPNEQGRAALADMVRWCNEVGLPYVIAVREGPGRQSVDQGAADTIWTTANQQQLYAEMLREDIVEPYAADPLFVGLNVLVEPNPLAAAIKSGAIETPAQLADAMQTAGIDVHAMLDRLIAEVRKADKTLPILVQNVGWSSPYWWSLARKHDDPFVVYDVHMYQPYGYTHPECEAPSCDGLRYPGQIGGEEYDAERLRETDLDEVIAFQAEHQVPIFMGEFGMRFRQLGGVAYLSDLADLALDHGWHFCLWSFRPDTSNPSMVDFDPEKWGSAYWTEITSWWAPSATRRR